MTSYPTTDGGVVTDHREAFAFADRLLVAAGYRLIDASAQSRSAYYGRPGSERVIRLADHPNYHPGRHAEVVEARLTTVRAEIERRWVDESEGEIVERDYVTAIAEAPEQIEAIVRRAIADYEA